MLAPVALDDLHGRACPRIRDPFETFGLARLDLGQEYAEYHSIQSIRASVVLNQNARAGQIFRRNPDETWTYEASDGEAILHLPEAEISVPLGEIHQGVELAD